MDVGAISRMIDLGGEQFPVAEAGAGPAVLLLHGFPDSRFLWRQQLPALAEAGFRAIAPDLRGFGDAPRPKAVRPSRQPLLDADVKHDATDCRAAARGCCHHCLSCRVLFHVPDEPDDVVGHQPASRIRLP